jgi:CarD family transcriptional regulator
VFKIGDLVVYPTHGIGIIEFIEAKNLSGQKKSFYIMRILENDMVIMVPTDNVQTVGVRAIISKDEIPRVYTVLKNNKKPFPDIGSHNKRHRELMDKLKTGSIYDTAEVLRELALLREEKTLSFSERKILNTARRLLVQEISIVYESSKESVDAQIKQILNL